MTVATAPPTRQDVACDACGAVGTPQPITMRPDGRGVVECPGCGLAWITPRPSADEIERMYDASYFSGERSGSGVGYTTRFTASEEARLAAQHGSVRLDIIGAHRALDGARLLELGCALGDFCAQAAQRGAETLGVDISAEAIEMARARHPQLHFQVGTAESSAERLVEHDVVCAFEVIEHVPSPTSFLRAAASLLAPSGILALSTPNYAEARRLGADHWLGFRISFEHLYFLDADALGTLASSAGLEIVDWYATGDGLWQAPAAPGMGQRLLAAVGLLPAARRVKRLLAGPARIDYARQGQGHTLFAILRRRVGS